MLAENDGLRFVSLPVEKLGKKPDRKPPRPASLSGLDWGFLRGRLKQSGVVAEKDGLLSLALSSKGGEGNARRRQSALSSLWRAMQRAGQGERRR
jgi:hypothetical protein